MAEPFAPPHNLPSFPTSFIGREDETIAVLRRLRASRLVTLTGPAGCGKTRLALHVASTDSDHYPGGTWLCDLASVTDPGQVPLALGAILQVPEVGDRSWLKAIPEALGSRPALVILDNCEHVVGGCAALGHHLLRACPELQLLCTSLQPLRLPEEIVWPVPPLALPEASDPGGLMRSDAVQLFVERASRVQPAFRLTDRNTPYVAAICRRLDGLPLAVELAAARARLLTVEQIAERLDDVFTLLTRGSPGGLPRHRTMRATLDWGYQFLAPAEQSLLCRLSIFTAPFTLPMTEAVAGVEPGPTSTLDLLASLTDRSFLDLLPHEAGRPATYRLLEVIRQYARERLEDSGESTVVRDRHLQWCLAWVQVTQPKSAAPGQSPSNQEVQRNLEHARSALRWACTAQRFEDGLRLAVALGSFWLTEAVVEGRGWLEELLQRHAGQPQISPVSDDTLAWARMWSGRLAVRFGDDDHGRRRGLESLEAFRRLGDHAGTLAAINVLALAAQDTRAYDEAAALYQEGLGLSRAAGDDRMTAVLLVNQGLMYYEQEDPPRAGPLWEEAQAIAVRLNDSHLSRPDNLGCLAQMRGDLSQAVAYHEASLNQARTAGGLIDEAVFLSDLGETRRRRGDLEVAEALLLQALALHQQLGNLLRIGETKVYLARLRADQGRPAEARRLLEESLPELQRSSFSRFLSHAFIHLALLNASEGNDPSAEDSLRQALRVAQSGRHRLARLRALEEIGGLWADHDPTAAVRLLAASQVERESLGLPIEAEVRPRRTQLEATLRRTLGETAYQSQWTAGAASRAEEVAAELLQAEALRARRASVPDSSSVPVLRMFAFGEARVVLEGRLLGPADWTYAKSKELLFYLLSHESATKAQIGLDLWPEASPERLRSAFHSALHHLRRALGDREWIRHSAGRYSFHRHRPFAYDVQEFEDHVRLARQALNDAGEATPRDRLLFHLAAAVQISPGDYLADAPAAEWALYPRETIRQARLEALLELAELHFGDADYPASAATFEQVLALDGYLEIAHRGLMRCYARLGEAGRAVRHYQGLVDLLRLDLDTTPSPESVLLHERIRRGDDI